ncbi:MSHA biogenesis protein MshP [Paraglaciecola sp. MB-3u-78]|uniref:MSHA biogenesis protein MshP n=1 Tax=Paraglaciecola sp. MB-3u-78 TaxID=2058332 RepID=UPI000C329694|nr:MSHA biogenesis protein MshP [Paraglaciecola sp. MB-3u-78]PKG97788.1 MSHA biogenesis protein MshP [Paraglaciecola sp. MB-3u-78]
MYLKRKALNLAASPRYQHGSMLVIALFVIIVLALLGLTMTRLLSSTSETIIHEVLGQRAINAARSGIECAVAAEVGAGCSNPAFKDLSGVAGLENCNYSVAAMPPKTITDGGSTFTYLTFTSTGQCTAGKINVTRIVYVDAMLEED